MKLLKYFIFQLLNNKSFTILFILNLSFGLSSFVTLDIFKHSINKSIKKRSKVFLGADLGVSARRAITKEESNLISEASTEIHSSTKLIEVFSMVVGPNEQSKLVQIKAVDNNFPFYGQIEIKDKNNSISNGQIKTLNNKKIAWLYPELIAQLNVRIGENIKVGNTSFTVQAIITNDNAEGVSTSMAPRLYIGYDHIQDTGLLQFGSVVWYSQLYHLPRLNDLELNNLKISLKKQIPSTDLKFYTHESVSEQSSRLLKYLNDFLGLVAIAALFLAAIGGAFLFRSYLNKQIHIFGIFLSLGMTLKSIMLYQAVQLLILGLIGSSISILFGYLLIPILNSITADLIPFTIIKQLEPNTIILILLLGCAGALLIGLPLITQLIGLKPNLLFSSKTQNNLNRNKWFWLSLIPGFLFLWSLSIWQSHSFKTGTLFTILFLASGLLLSILAALFMYFISKIKIKKYLGLQWAIRDISRFKITSISIFLSIGLGMLLLNLIPQIKASINYELTMPHDSKLPSFFIFDIQEEQLSTLKKISSHFDITLQQTSPMVRARLKTINYQNYSELQITESVSTREQERQQRSRNRGYNLSYRLGLGTGESLHKGKLINSSFDENSGKLPEISVEKRFAARLGIKINDVLEFDIQGVSIKGKIVNIRKVKWTTFQPNFFIQFQPGVLEIAPKTYLSSVPKISNTMKNELQNKIVKAIPNASIIDVSRLVKKLKDIIEQMGLALQFMTIICLIAGFLVLFSIANYQARQRSSDIAILKVLGSSFTTIRSYFLWMFTLLSILSGLFGISICFIFSYIISKLLFDSKWVFDIYTPALSLIGLLIISILITFIAINQFLNTKASSLLDNE